MQKSGTQNAHCQHPLTYYHLLLTIWARVTIWYSKENAMCQKQCMFPYVFEKGRELLRWLGQKELNSTVGWKWIHLPKCLSHFQNIKQVTKSVHPIYHLQNQLEIMPCHLKTKHSPFFTNIPKFLLYLSIFFYSLFPHFVNIWNIKNIC